MNNLYRNIRFASMYAAYIVGLYNDRTVIDWNTGRITIFTQEPTYDDVVDLLDSTYIVGTIVHDIDKEEYDSDVLFEEMRDQHEIGAWDRYGREPIDSFEELADNLYRDRAMNDEHLNTMYRCMVLDVYIATVGDPALVERLHTFKDEHC